MYKIIKRDIYPVTFMHIACVDNKERTKFIARANYILDKNVLRFTYEDNDIVLIFVGMNRKHSKQSLQLLMENSMQIMYAITIKSKADADKLRVKYEIR
jgi:malate/lactate dehydrogenase